MLKNFETLNRRIAQLETDTLLVVWDKKVRRLHGKKIKFPAKRVIHFVAPSGENAKSISSWTKGMEFFLKKGIHRQSHLIAIGGGTITDIGGFIAATLLRGISWSAIPTTLLGMVDASIGGKTGLDSSSGKNLIGAFHAPVNVWLFPGFLKTLPEREIKNGFGEIIKYALLDKKTFKLLQNGKSIEKLILSCARFKEKVVALDFQDSKQRKILNMGHTIGHALETSLRIPHGVAVANGIRIIDKAFNGGRLSLLIEDLMRFSEIPILKIADAKRLFPLILRDKKRTSADSLVIVVPRGIGWADILEVGVDEFKARMGK
jgi:3-dehydroquinate synthetase